MKSLYIMSLLGVAAMLGSCKNQYHEFESNQEQAIYFPVQYPVRTLVLGETRLDNSVDLQNAFHVGVCVGGGYSNENSWTVDYEVDPSLVPEGMKATNADGEEVTVKVLPDYYYTLEPENSVVIPKGSFNGLIRVNISDAFFEDENACKFNYVLPMKITGSSGPKILWGTPSVENANIFDASQWSATDQPRFFTLFGVKFINMLDGVFFHRGKQFKMGTNGEYELEKEFAYDEFEEGQTANVTTLLRHRSAYDRMGEWQDGSKYQTILDFSEKEYGEGIIEVSAPEGANYRVFGTGKYYDSTTQFAKEHGSWLVDPQSGEETPHLTMTLDYFVENLNGENYQFQDTLVFRNNNVTFETFTPVVSAE